MRPTTEDAAEVEHQVLSTEAGLALLAEVAAVERLAPSDLARWRRRDTPERVAAAVRLAEGCRRGVAKFSKAAAMWFDPVGLEQSTSEAVARHKARRFAGAPVVLDLCCGIGGDALALAAEADRVLAVDLDRGMLRRASWNAGAYGVADRLQPVRSRAETVASRAEAAVHVDPDRRASGSGRSRTLAGYVPGLDFLRTLPRRHRGGAIKLGPASDFAGVFGGEGFEVEIVSLEGECKEATVWFGTLATARRRATSLPSGASWTDRDGPLGVVVSVGPGDVLHEPDPALARAGLLDGFAAAHGLSRFARGIDLLAGPEAWESPFLRSFAVEAVLPLDERTLRREAARRGLAFDRIKTRGLAEVRRRALVSRLPAVADEGRPATLFLLNGPEGGAAVMAAPLP